MGKTEDIKILKARLFPPPPLMETITYALFKDVIVMIVAVVIVSLCTQLGAISELDFISVIITFCIATATLIFTGLSFTVSKQASQTTKRMLEIEEERYRTSTTPLLYIAPDKTPGQLLIGNPSDNFASYVMIELYLLYTYPDLKDLGSHPELFRSITESFKVIEPYSLGPSEVIKECVEDIVWTDELKKFLSNGDNNASQLVGKLPRLNLAIRLIWKRRRMHSLVRRVLYTLLG